MACANIYDLADNLLEWAKGESEITGRSPYWIISQALTATMRQAVSKGGTIVISTSEAGGSVSLHIQDDQTPAMVQSALKQVKRWLEQQADPNTMQPPAMVRVMRARASFFKAIIS